MTRVQTIQKYYESRYGSGDLGMSSRTPKSFKPFLDLLGVNSQSNLLDVGCGSGALLEYMGKADSISGIDLSENAIRIARLNQPEANYCVGDMQNLPYRSSSFDKVTNIGSLEHVPEMKKALKEMKRVCSDIGKLCIVVPNKDFLLYRLLILKGTEQAQMEEHLLSLLEWKELIQTSGLKIIVIDSDPGPELRTDLGCGYFLRGLVRSLILLLTKFFPLEYTYQYVFICTKS